MLRVFEGLFILRNIEKIKNDYFKQLWKKKKH